MDMCKPRELRENLKMTFMTSMAILIQAPQGEGATTISSESRGKCLEARGTQCLLGDDIVWSYGKP